MFDTSYFNFWAIRINFHFLFLVEMKPAIDVLNDMGIKEFVSLVKSSGLEEKLDSQNMTMFIPSDTAMKHFEEKMEQSVSSLQFIKCIIKK